MSLHLLGNTDSAKHTAPSLDVPSGKIDVVVHRAGQIPAAKHLIPHTSDRQDLVNQPCPLYSRMFALQQPAQGCIDYMQLGLHARTRKQSEVAEAMSSTQGGTGNAT